MLIEDLRKTGNSPLVKVRIIARTVLCIRTQFKIGKNTHLERSSRCINFVPGIVFIKIFSSKVEKKFKNNFYKVFFVFFKDDNVKQFGSESELGHISGSGSKYTVMWLDPQILVISKIQNFVGFRS